MSDKDSKVVAHARRELTMAGLFEKNDNYDGQLGRGLLALIKVFDKYGKNKVNDMEALAHGFSQLVGGGLLSSPTTDPNEWEQIEGAGPGIVRNIRSPFYVSEDNGANWQHIETKESGKSEPHVEGDTNDEQSTNSTVTGNPKSKTRAERTDAPDDAEATSVDPTDATEGGVSNQSKDANNTSDVAPESAGDNESSSSNTPASGGGTPAPGSRVDDAVDSQSSEDKGESKSESSEPEAGKN